MENVHYDSLTFEELTPENVIPFMDEYVRNVAKVNANTVIDIMLYLDYALSIKDNELLFFMIWRIIHHFDNYQYTFGDFPHIP